VKEVVDYVFEEHCDNGKRRELYGFGVSLGASIMANYMGKEREKCPLRAAFVVGCCFDTPKSMEFIKSNMYGFYDYFLGYG